MPRKAARTQNCGRAHAQTRLAHARKFLEVAELVGTERGLEESVSCAAALAVLAGIAASDAACCARLGRRSRGQDHVDAADLLEQIEPEGKNAAKALRELIAIKDRAHYGLINISQPSFTGAMRRARDLVDFAGDAIRG
jgi:hypothetical protein